MGLGFLLAPTSGWAQDKTTFQEHVLPLVESHCAKCHNADKKKADLDLTSQAAVLKGSASGLVVASGNPDNSKLWKVLIHAEEPFMPPSKPKLSDKELEVFKKWIAGGLLDNAGSKAVAASKSSVDLSLKSVAYTRPDGPPPMPAELPLEPVMHTPRGTAINGLAASPWAPLIAVTGQKQVLLYHADTLEPIGILPFSEGQPWDLKFSRNGQLLLAGGGHAGKSGRVVVWNVATGEKLMILGDEYDTVLAADLSPDQRQVALGGPGRTVKLVATRTGETLFKIKKHTDWVTALAYSPDGLMLATADRNGGLSLWDPDNAQELFALAGHKSAVTALSWRDDARVLASSSEDGTVKLWEMQEGKQVKSWTAHGPGALGLSYAHDGRLASCGRDNAVALWDANGARARAFEFFGDVALRAVISHDGRRVFATDFAGRIGVWNANDGKRLGELNANPQTLAEQVAAAEQQVQTVKARAAEVGKAAATAEADLYQAMAAWTAATNALEQAKSVQATREAEVAKLKQLATNAPPSDLDAKLAAARAERQKARGATTNATQVASSKARELEPLKARVAKLKADIPDSELRAAQERLARLKAAQAFVPLYRARETLSRKKREHERATALVSATQQVLAKAEQELATARAAATKAEEQMRSSKAELVQREPPARQLAGEIAAGEAALKPLAADYERAKAAVPPSPTPAKTR